MDAEPANPNDESEEIDDDAAEAKQNLRDRSESEKKYWPKCDTSIWLRSCEQELIEPISGKVSGTIPKWLRGSLLRNGPGNFKFGDYTLDHLFDGSALLHRFEIGEGTVKYQRRFVETNAYKKNLAAQRIVLHEFGTRAVPDPCQSIFQRISAVFNPADSMSDNSMISVYPFGDEYYTFAEAPVIHRIDPKTLETKERVDLTKYVGIVNHSSHPHVMNDGTVYNLGMSFAYGRPVHNIICFPPSQLTVDDSGEEKELSMFDQATVVATVPARWHLNPSYMHTFGITENYFLIVEQPLSIALFTLAMCQMKNEPLCRSLKWYENENTIIQVVSRETGQIAKTFVAEAFFYMHIINQFETRDKEYIVIDICCYRDGKMLDCMFVDAMKNMHSKPDYAQMFRGRPLRFILPMKCPAEDVPPEQNLITATTMNQSLKAFEDLPNPTCKTPDYVPKAADEQEASDLKTNNESQSVLGKRASAHRLPDGTVFVGPELLCDLGCETPRINYESHLGTEYRYFYAISSDVDLENSGTIIKVDTLTKSRKIWCENGVFPSEPIFVPDPNGRKEDDGVVVSALVSGCDRENEVGLLVLDATTLKEIARAEFDAPGPAPKCLHGWFNFDK